jgi:hypothetical protein
MGDRTSKNPGIADYVVARRKRKDCFLDEIGPMAGGCIYADKGYISQLNRHVIQARGLTDGIMHKTARNRALSASEKVANRLSAASGQRWNAPPARSNEDTDSFGRAIWGCPRSS